MVSSPYARFKGLRTPSMAVFGECNPHLAVSCLCIIQALVHVCTIIDNKYTVTRIYYLWYNQAGYIAPSCRSPILSLMLY